MSDRVLSPHPCQRCGGEVWTAPNQDGSPRNRKYCGEYPCTHPYRRKGYPSKRREIPGNCVECGAGFVGGPRRKYCQPCAKRINIERAKQRYRENKNEILESLREQRRQCLKDQRKKRPIMVLERHVLRIQKRAANRTRQCSACGTWFVLNAWRITNKDKNWACSSQCAAAIGGKGASRMWRKVRRGEAHIPEGTARMFDIQREIGAIKRIGTIQRNLRERGSRVRSCRICHAPFVPKTTSVVCSAECAADRRMSYSYNRHIERYKDGVECIVCSTIFCAVYGTKEQQKAKLDVCSDECRDAHTCKTKRKWKAFRCAHERGALPGSVRFDPFEVFRRDKWKCQACGVDTPKRLRGTYEDDAPELDHIIPLSRGGWHAPDNCQTLCRSCNGDKLNQLPHEWKATSNQLELL